MVIGPGWGQDSVGTDGGVSILPDGSTVVGDYGETTVIKGNGSGVHTQLKSSDDAVDQTVYLTTKARTLNEGSVFFSQQTATKNQLWIGAGSSPNQILPVTEGKLVAHTLSYASGSTKLWWSTDGVNVGTNPAAPTSGRAFQVTTTAQASAFYVDDSDGTCHFPWSGNTSAPNVAIGAGSELRLLNTGAASYVYAATDQLIVYQSSPNDILYQCANGGGGDHIFQTRGSTEVGRFGANGLVLPLNGSTGSPNLLLGDGTTTYHLFTDGVDNFIKSNAGRLFLVNEAKTVIQQNDAAYGGPVVELIQDDTDMPFIDFTGTAGSGNSIDTRTTSGAVLAHARCEYNGTTCYIALTATPS